MCSELVTESSEDRIRAMLENHDQTCGARIVELMQQLEEAREKVSQMVGAVGEACAAADKATRERDEARAERDNANVAREAEWRDHKVTKAALAAVQESHSRLEASAAAMREAVEPAFEEYIGHGDEPSSLVHAFEVFRDTDAGRALLERHAAEVQKAFERGVTKDSEDSHRLIAKMTAELRQARADLADARKLADEYRQERDADRALLDKAQRDRAEAREEIARLRAVKASDELRADYAEAQHDRDEYKAALGRAHKALHRRYGRLLDVRPHAPTCGCVDCESFDALADPSCAAAGAKVGK
jgi:chromosome segregation ATPase